MEDQPLHILIVPSVPFVPKETPLEGIFERWQAKALHRNSYKVGVIAPQLRSVRMLKHKLFGWPRGIEIDYDENMPVFRYHAWSYPQRLTSLSQWQWMRTAMILFKRYVKERGRPDIIHAHNAVAAGLVASRIKDKYKIPYVLTEHSTFYLRELFSSKTLSSVRSASINADARIVVSPRLGNDLEKVLGKDVVPWEVVGNVLDELFVEKGDSGDTGRQFRDRFVFLSAGNLIEIKGHGDLLSAFALEFRGNANVHLRIAGEGPLRNELGTLSKKLGIAGQVTFLGYLNRQEILEQMCACDAYVHSSHYETFGVTIIEALACGKPVVSTACGGPEYIVNQQNGTLAPVMDIKAIADAMGVMMVKAKGYDSKQIREHCISRFGERAIVDKLSAIYRRVLENSTAELGKDVFRLE
ncbi:MAG: glycosyltransferase [Thermodesulfovibrionales bacterium]